MPNHENGGKEAKNSKGNPLENKFPIFNDFIFENKNPNQASSNCSESMSSI
jgi:hypothetical protein